jgi:tetratricopeptide (TPR) repeat protein
VADELPWQLSQAEDWSALRDVLRDDRMLAILMSGERKHELLALWRQIGDRFDLAATYLECIERLRGDDHPTSRRRSAMRNAAHLLVMAEVWEPAEQLFRALLQDNTQEFGDDSVEVSDTLTDLGAMLGHITRYEEGEEMVLRAIGIRERHFGRESRQTSDSLRMLGWLFFEQRRYAEAEPIYRRRLEIDEAEYGSNDARICDDANNLACQLWNLGRFQEADALYQRALETGRSAFGPDHPKLAMVYNNHAVMLGRWAATESTERDPRVLEYLQRAIQINEKWYGLSHSETASAVSNLGSLLLEYGRFEEGLQLLKRAALRYDGATDIVTIRVGLLHGYLARAELGMGNVGLALKSQQLAHGLLLKVHGPLHEPTALSLGALSHLLCESGRGDEACGLVRDMLRDLEERENVDPALTWFHRVQLCYALRRSGHSGEAMDLIEAVVKQMGDTAAWRLRQRGFTEYAWVLLERGAVGQAVEAATAACAVENPGIGWRASLIRAHAELALASALLAAGDRGEAERRARVALPLFERFAGPQHPDTRAARTLLARLAPDDSGPGDTETQHADSNQVRSRM